MKRVLAAMVAAIFILAGIDPAVCARVQAAALFPDVPIESPAEHAHYWAYASMIAGAGLIGSSFLFSKQANDAYDRYLEETDPVELERSFDRAKRYDRLSTASLLGGQVMIATGLYLRFLRRPSGSRLSFSAGSERCQVAWRF